MVRHAFDYTMKYNYSCSKYKKHRFNSGLFRIENKRKNSFLKSKTKKKKKKSFRDSIKINNAIVFIFSTTNILINIFLIFF